MFRQARAMDHPEGREAPLSEATHCRIRFPESGSITECSDRPGGIIAGPHASSGRRPGPSRDGGNLRRRIVPAGALPRGRLPRRNPVAVSAAETHEIRRWGGLEHAELLHYPKGPDASPPGPHGLREPAIAALPEYIRRPCREGITALANFSRRQGASRRPCRADGQTRRWRATCIGIPRGKGHMPKRGPKGWSAALGGRDTPASSSRAARGLLRDVWCLKRRAGSAEQDAREG